MMAKAAKAKTKTPSNRLPELLGLPDSFVWDSARKV